MRRQNEDDWDCGSTSGRAEPAKGSSFPCRACASAVELRHHDGIFFATCPQCGRKGSDSDSAYNALMAWRRELGQPTRSMVGQLLMIVLVLALVAGMLWGLSWLMEAAAPGRA